MRDSGVEQPAATSAKTTEQLRKISEEFMLTVGICLLAGKKSFHNRQHNLTQVRTI